MIGSARHMVIAVWMALVVAGLIVAWAVQGAGPLPGDTLSGCILAHYAEETTA